jgi:hypothetical protein
VRTVRQEVPQTVAVAITKALARARTDRYTTAEEFVDALTARVPSAQKRWWMVGGKH